MHSDAISHTISQSRVGCLDRRQRPLTHHTHSLRRRCGWHSFSVSGRKGRRGKASEGVVMAARAAVTNIPLSYTLILLFGAVLRRCYPGWHRGCRCCCPRVQSVRLTLACISHAAAIPFRRCGETVSPHHFAAIYTQSLASAAEPVSACRACRPINALPLRRGESAECRGETFVFP